MRVKLLTGRVGNGWTQEAGQVIEVSDAEGRRMIDGWQAVAVVDAKPKPQEAGKPLQRK